jgi:hypothetical protein
MKPPLVPRFSISRCVAAALCLGLTACALTPPPTEQVAVARASLSQAQTAGANELAPLELTSARTKLEQAEAAMVRRDFERARQLAEEADVDARLALIKSESTRQQRAVAELRQSIDVLQQELQRGR